MVSIVALIVVAGVVAILVTGGSAKTSNAHEVASVSITGSALPVPATPDPAVGVRAPAVSGISFGGESVSIPVAGQPTAIIFLAHWCPHCQADVPVIQGWLAKNGMPSDIEIRTVSTWVSSSKPNYPPSTWLRDAGWTPPVLVDDSEGSTATAYGLSGTPMYVFVGKDGLVKFRLEGEITAAQFAQALDRLRAA